MFKTRIYHCNVDTAGNLIIEILNDSWSPALTITKVLLAIRSIFTNPNPCKFFRSLDASNQLCSSLVLTIIWVEERNQLERKRRETHRRHLGPDLESLLMELKVWFRDFGNVKQCAKTGRNL